MDAPPRRSSAGSLALAFIAIVGSAAGGLWYHAALRERGAAAPADRSGFDIAAPSQTRPSSSGSALPGPAPRSGLGMVGAIPGMRMSPGQAAPHRRGQDATAQAAASFTELVRRCEKAFGDLAWAYTRRSAVIRQYGRDWMSYPDLRKLNDDYMRDHDPAAFMRGLANSPNFPTLVKRYATQPVMRDFVMDGMKTAPAEALGTAMAYLGADRTLETLVERVASSLGLPPALLKQATPSGAPRAPTP